ncbi:MAG: translation initiation factor IF-1 [Candidatus Cloacimonetes bacterium]|nr:translation initiation factor IF-1 [Candidatus Cloacimonadota bacterium]
MTKKDIVEAEGEVIETLPNAYFRVKLDGSDEPILAVISGRMRRYFIKILPGDRVRVEMNKQDLKHGRIVYRYK